MDIHNSIAELCCYAAPIRGGRKFSKAAARSNPHLAIGRNRKSIQVAVIPNEAVIHVDVGPYSSIENLYSMFGASPKLLPAVESQKID